MPQSGLRGGRDVRGGRGDIKRKFHKKERINAKVSRPNVADWQYLGVDKFTLGLAWNCGRKARKGHICEDTFAYGSYSSKDKAKTVCNLFWRYTKYSLTWLLLT